MTEKEPKPKLTERIAAAADEPLPFHAAGEIIGDTPIQIQVVPDARKVIVPAVVLPAEVATRTQVA